eukprot:104359-Prymnesium_polylepis.1
MVLERQLGEEARLGAEGEPVDAAYPLAHLGRRGRDGVELVRLEHEAEAAARRALLQLVGAAGE